MKGLSKGLQGYKHKEENKEKASNKVKDIDTDNDINASENTAKEFDTPEEFVKWFNTNYPKPINADEEIKLLELAIAIAKQDLLGKRIRTNIQGVKRLAPGMVSPPIAWLNNEIEQFRNNNVPTDL